MIETMPFGHLIDVEHDFLLSAGTPFFAAVYGEFASLLEPGIIVIAIIKIGYGFVCLFYPAYYLVVELFLKGFGML
jgi:hypothetical protein